MKIIILLKSTRIKFVINVPVLERIETIGSEEATQQTINQGSIYKNRSVSVLPLIVISEDEDHGGYGLATLQNARRRIDQAAFAKTNKITQPSQSSSA